MAVDTADSVPAVHKLPANGEPPTLEPAPAKKAFNIIEMADENYVEKISDPVYASSTLSNPLDVAVSRQWVDDVVMKLPRAPPAASRTRKLADMAIKTIPVTYGQDGKFSVRVYVPALEDGHGRRAGLIMYHGGGWVHSYPEVDEHTAIFFASELRAVVVNVDYRLAPENKFPVPMEDCWQAIQWTIDQADEYNIDISRIGLMGGSAGGNLAAAVALRDAVEHTKSRLCHVSLLVPATCHPDVYPQQISGPEASTSKFGTEFRELIKALLAMYAGQKATEPGVSVLTADIPPNHPPVYVCVGGRDVLRDEGIAYALRLRNAGIDAQLQIVPGAEHGITFPPNTHVARQTFRDIARVIDYALNCNK